MLSWMTTFATVPTGTGNGLLNNLVSYRKADTSGSFPDAHSSNNGTINGATYTASGILNGAYSFDGSNDDITISASSELEPSSISISLWFKDWTDNAGVNNEFIINYLSNTTVNVAGILFISSTELRCYVNVGGTVYSQNVTPTGLTSGDNHILYTYDSATGNYQIFFNGSLEDSGNIGTSGGINYAGTSRNIYLGQRGNGTRYTNITIDETGIFDSALDSTDATNLYNSGSPLPYSSFTT